MNEDKKESKLELDPNFVERMSDDSGLVIVKKNPKQSK